MAQFGKDTDGTNVQTFSGDRMYLSAATPSSSGIVTNGSGRVRITATGSTLVKAVIFGDSGTGNPLTYLAQSDEVTVNWTTSTLTNFPFSGANQISIVSGTQYWIGYWFDDPGVPSFEMKRDNNLNVNRFRAEVYSSAGTPTSPFASDGNANGPLNCAIDYTEPSGNNGSFFAFF
jgi:hypothetical protein